MTRPILVTGSTGLLGRALVRRRLAEGATVRVLARSKRSAEEVFAESLDRLEVVPGDLTHPDSLAGACEGVETVFHCASLGPSSFGPGNSIDDYRRVNVEGTRSLLAEASRQGVSRFVYVSSTGAMGPTADGVVDESTPCRPASAYERSKRAAEEILLAQSARGSLRTVIVRPCLIAGEGKRGGELLRLFRLCRRGLFPVVGRRLTIRKPLVWVDDVADALGLAAERGRSGAVYLVHSGGEHTLGEILRVAGRLVGNPRPFVNVPLPLARGAARLTTPVARALGLHPPLAPERLEMLIADRRICIDRARRELGYVPRVTDLEEMLGRTHADHVRRGELPASETPG